MYAESSDIKDQLLESFTNQLNAEWSRLRKAHYNPGTKGTSYEKTLADFLKKYMGNLFEIKTKAALLDEQYEIFDLLSSGENEFDVVAMYKQTKPRILLQQEDMLWLPFNGVAFVSEVKSKLTKPNLDEDLSKLKKLRQIENNLGERFGVTIGGGYDVERHLLALVYDQDSIDKDFLHKKLTDSSNIWDLLLLVESNQVFVNLPYNKIFYPDEDEQVTEFPSNGLLHFLLSLSISLPYPTTVSTVNTFLSLL